MVDGHFKVSDLFYFFTYIKDYGYTNNQKVILIEDWHLQMVDCDFKIRERDLENGLLSDNGRSGFKSGRYAIISYMFTV